MKQTAIINRLKTIVGHLRGIEEMIEQHRPCEDILLQTHAVTKSMQKIEQLILQNYLDECISLHDREEQAKLLKLIELIQK